MSKDKDMMRDTGGTFHVKNLVKPPRSDRKKPKNDKSDPDFKDTRRDPDLKKGCRMASEELMRMARVISAFDKGMVKMHYSIDGEGVLTMKFDWSGAGSLLDDSRDALLAFEYASNIVEDVGAQIKEVRPGRMRDTLERQTYRPLDDGNGLEVDFDTGLGKIEGILKQRGFARK